MSDTSNPHVLWTSKASARYFSEWHNSSCCSSGTTQVNLATLTYCRCTKERLCSLFQRATTQGFEARRGTLYNIMYRIHFNFRSSTSHRCDFSFVDIVSIDFSFIDIVSIWFFVYRYRIELTFRFIDILSIWFFVYRYPIDLVFRSSISCRFYFSFIDIVSKVLARSISITAAQQYHNAREYYSRFEYYVYIKYWLYYRPEKYIYQLVHKNQLWRQRTHLYQVALVQSSVTRGSRPCLLYTSDAADE